MVASSTIVPARIVWDYGNVRSVNYWEEKGGEHKRIKAEQTTHIVCECRQAIKNDDLAGKSRERTINIGYLRGRLSDGVQNSFW